MPYDVEEEVRRQSLKKKKIAEHVGTTIPHRVAISVQIVRIGEWMLLVLR